MKELKFIPHARRLVLGGMRSILTRRYVNSIASLCKNAVRSYSSHLGVLRPHYETSKPILVVWIDSAEITPKVERFKIEV